LKTIHIIISGKVQGVGFRYFAQLKATEHHICGWVRNTLDGKVEIEAEGNQHDLEIFVECLKTGPTRSIVKQVMVSEIKPERNFTAFSAR
jgi:acylphosphatase